MKPSAEDQALWEFVAGTIHYGRDSVKTLILCEIDELPKLDGRGRRRVDGWQVSWEGKVLDEWANFVGSLHGAASAWIVDTCTSAAIVAVHTETFWGPPMMAGVSLGMELQYLHAAPIGTKIRITVTILKCTETLANLRCQIADYDNGKVYVIGNHLKTWKQLAKL